jgi:hypothetical protein
MSSKIVLNSSTSPLDFFLVVFARYRHSMVQSDEVIFPIDIDLVTLTRFAEQVHVMLNCHLPHALGIQQRLIDELR